MPFLYNNFYTMFQPLTISGYPQVNQLKEYKPISIQTTQRCCTKNKSKKKNIKYKKNKLKQNKAWQPSVQVRLFLILYSVFYFNLFFFSYIFFSFSCCYFLDKIFVLFSLILVCTIYISSPEDNHWLLVVKTCKHLFYNDDDVCL